MHDTWERVERVLKTIDKRTNVLSPQSYREMFDFCETWGFKHITFTGGEINWDEEAAMVNCSLYVEISGELETTRNQRVRIEHALYGSNV
jgi:hypothetical protein